MTEDEALEKLKNAIEGGKDLSRFVFRYGMLFALNKLGGSITITKEEVEDFNERHKDDEGTDMFQVNTTQTEITIKALLD